MRRPSHFVTEQTALDGLCARWKNSGWIAFDTEFIRDDTYDAILCLVQVNDGESVYLIDPTAGVDVSGFWSLVSDPAVMVIVHAGKEDFEVCARTTGEPPRNLFDVQIAAGFVGFGYPLSLARLVQSVLNRRLAKGQTLTDWLRRPLTEEQVRYAVDDVGFLPELHRQIDERLQSLGRRSWAEEEFRRFEDPAIYRPPPEDRLFKLKGSKKLNARGLAVLRALVAWRDQWAQENNRPARGLMRDDVLVEVARRQPSEQSQLQVMRGFYQARNRKVVDGILTAIETAVATPSSAWPEPFVPREETPMMRAMLDVLTASMRAICFENDIDSDLVGSSRRLRELMDYLREGGEPPALLRGWREDFIGRRLVELLEGRSELHVSGWPEEPRLDVVSTPERASPNSD